MYDIHVHLGPASCHSVPAVVSSLCLCCHRNSRHMSVKYTYICTYMCPCETGACTVIREARAGQTVKLSLVKVRGDSPHSHGWYRT